MMGSITVNGRFLTQPLGGVQRYAREIVRALDRLISDDPHGLGAFSWKLAAPENSICDLELQHIRFAACGRRRGHVWEQIDLRKAAHGGVLVNLGNSGPLFRTDSLVVIHDAAVFRTPSNFSRRYALFHQVLGQLLARSSMIGTVSEFSRREISTVLKLPPETIFVAHNGADHLIGRPVDDSVLDAYGLTARRYFLFVGAPAPNKNLDMALRAFGNLNRPGIKFVLVGARPRAVFRSGIGQTPQDVIFTRRLSDEQVAALYRHAAALVFPSRYEGFGIPPLEAMINDCPVLAADIPALRETCGDAALFFDPANADGLSRLMRKRLDAWDDLPASLARGKINASRYTWQGGAEKLASAILGVAGKTR